MVLEKTLESPLETLSRRSNQSILKEINPEYLLEGLMLKLSWMQRTDSLAKTLMLGKMQEQKRETEHEMVG